MACKNGLNKKQKQNRLNECNVFIDFLTKSFILRFKFSLIISSGRVMTWKEC